MVDLSLKGVAIATKSHCFIIFINIIAHTSMISIELNKIMHIIL